MSRERQGELLVLSRADVAQCLDAVALRDYLKQAFIAFSNGEASVPPRVAAQNVAGLLVAMPGFVSGVGLGLKAISVFPSNDPAEMPSHQGLIALFDPDHGTPTVVMDASLVTEVRTSVSAAMAVDLGARGGATTLAVIGAGALGREHMRVLQGIRPWADIRVASRTAARAEALAAKYPGARALTSFEEAVRGADVVCLCTDADAPVIEHDWLAPGAHVSSVGIGAEIPSTTIAAAMSEGVVLVEWRGAALNAPPAGAHELQGHNAAGMVELGEVFAGRAAARRDQTSLTVYKSTGHAIEDLAAARLVLDAAAKGLGTRVPL